MTMPRMLRRAAVGVAAVGGLLAAGCGPVPATPNADYQFRHFDSSGRHLACANAGGPALSPLGQQLIGGTEVVDGVREDVAAFVRGGGYRLSPTTGEAGNTTYSVVVLFRLSDIGVFRRVLDFKHGTSDTGLYLAAGKLRLYPYTPTGTKVVAADEWVQVVLTRAGDGTVTGYVDGAQQWQLADINSVAVIDSENTLRFFQDNQSGGTTTEHAPGAVARIRVFDRALSATEVRDLGQTPSSPCAP
jgi:hypothetical protein